MSDRRLGFTRHEAAVFSFGVIIGGKISSSRKKIDHGICLEGGSGIMTARTNRSARGKNEGPSYILYLWQCHWENLGSGPSSGKRGGERWLVRKGPKRA